MKIRKTIKGFLKIYCICLLFFGSVFFPLTYFDYISYKSCFGSPPLGLWGKLPLLYNFYDKYFPYEVNHIYH